MPAGSAYQAKLPQAIIGPNHSGLFPNTVYLGMHNAAGTLLYMVADPIASSVFSTVLTGSGTEGVTNASSLSGGLPTSGQVVAGAGIYDAPSGGNLLVSGTFTASVTGDGTSYITFAAGTIILKYA